MPLLTTKLQYKYYEPGEFTATKERSYEEVVELIQQFPWQEQRQGVSMGLTCPSITIQNKEGDFLKLGPTYNDSYCLFLYTTDKKLYKKIFYDIKTSYETIAAFYEGKDIIPDFKPLTGYVSKRHHFITNDFIYTVDRKRILRFLSFPEIPFSIGFMIFWLWGVTTDGYYHGWENIMVVTLTSLPLFLLFSVNWLLFGNYYKHDKDNYLRMSQGHEKFLFGTKDNINEYSKNDILKITRYYNNGNRCPWSEYIIYKIELKDGREIKFTSLLCDRIRFVRGVYDIIEAEKHVYFPFIK